MLRRGWPAFRTEEKRQQRILVVCDSDGCRELLSRLLSAHGYTVERARSSPTAAAALATAPPHGVVLALVVGGAGSSLKLLDTIRAHPEPDVAATRVVVVADSSHNDLAAWQAGADAFLVRPFHADELHTQVHAALTRPPERRSEHRQHQLEIARAQPTSQPADDDPKFSK